MKLADRLTFARIALAPVFFIMYNILAFDAGRMPVVTNIVVLWILFAAIEITDLLDGWVARRKDGVSDFGKLFDPFADVLAHLTFFVCFSLSRLLPAWFLPLVLYREFGVTFIRMLLSGKGISMGARPGGKAKSFFYMLVSAAALALVTLKSLALPLDATTAAATTLAVLTWIAAALSVLSFADYFVQFRKLYRR
jgi:CDP-diacylglycerol--glycerol-3-phosphate 3-phosphatidyltransferase